jgi:hypothetical protein
MDGITNGPIFVTREQLQILVGGIVSAANSDPYVRLIDPFVEMVECDWCHRRIGERNLLGGVCPYCILSIRGSWVIARKVCSECKGVH